MTQVRPSTRSSGALSRLPALVGYVFRACVPPRRLGILALPCATIILSGLLARTVDEPTLVAFARVVEPAIFGLALPLGALVIGDAVLGAEVRSGTLPFTWLTPTRFWELVLSRWVGGWVLVLVTLVPSVALASLVAGASSQAPAAATVAAAGAAGHVALFVLIGAVTRRAAVWSLGIVFIVERLLGAVLSGIAQLSPTWLGRAVYTGIGDVPSDMTRRGVPEGWDAVVRLGVVAAVCLALASLALGRLQLTGTRD